MGFVWDILVGILGGRSCHFVFVSVSMIDGFEKQAMNHSIIEAEYWNNIIFVNSSKILISSWEKLKLLSDFGVFPNIRIHKNQPRFEN